MYQVYWVNKNEKKKRKYLSTISADSMQNDPFFSPAYIIYRLNALNVKWQKPQTKSKEHMHERRARIKENNREFIREKRIRNESESVREREADRYAKK